MKEPGRCFPPRRSSFDLPNGNLSSVVLNEYGNESKRVENTRICSPAPPFSTPDPRQILLFRSAMRVCLIRELWAEGLVHFLETLTRWEQQTRDSLRCLNLFQCSVNVEWSFCGLCTWPSLSSPSLRLLYKHPITWITQTAVSHIRDWTAAMILALIILGSEYPLSIF